MSVIRTQPQILKSNPLKQKANMKNSFNSLNTGTRSTILAIGVLLLLLAVSLATRAQPKSSLNFPDGKEGFLILNGLVKDSLEKKVKTEVKIEILDLQEN